uniref:Putative ribonuclease H-like domain-containing protein n=1 Tax=Tanacetum cinerariifolium TaxID=118510 RepID=A0A699HBB5_TANCI|nr:putative ribonuclease H-like domain-containing protein [Tanacetum cinerariifolium]
MVGTVKQPYEPTTIKEKLDRKNEMKARGTLLMALPNKDQLKFHSYQDVKFLMEAIEKRMQKLISQLEIQGEVIEQEDINLKLLRSLLSEWKTNALIWKNKAEIETISLDDLYNNLKIYEPELTGSSSISQNPQNVAFVSSNSTNSTSSTNEADNTAYRVSTAHTQGNIVNSIFVDNLSDAVICAFLASQPNAPQLAREDLEQIDSDGLEEMDLKWEMTMLTIKARSFIKRTGRNLDINGQKIGFDRSKVECFNCHKNGYFARECRAPKNQENNGREYGRKTVPMENPTENALIAQDEIGGTVESKVKFVDVKNKGVCSTIETKPVRKKNFSPPIIKDWISDDESEVEFEPKVKDKIVRPSIENIKFVKTARKTEENVETPKQHKHYPRGNQRIWNNLMSQRLGRNFKMIDKACYVCGSFEHLQYDCDKMIVRPVWNNSKRVNHKNFTNKITHPYPKRRFVSQANLTKSGKLKTAGTPINTVRPVNTTDSKPIVNYSRPTSNAFKKGYLQAIRPFNKYSSYKKYIFNKEVNVVKASACWVWKAKYSSASNTYKKYSYIDARGNKCYLTKDEYYDGGLFPLGMVKVECLEKFCDIKGIKREFSVPRTPQRNGVAERKNKTLIQAARTMLVDSKLPTTFWTESVNIACYVLNRALVIKPHNKTPYELIRFQTNGIAGTKDNIVAGQAEKKKEPEQDSLVSNVGPSFVNAASPSPINVAGTPASNNAFEEHPFERFSPFKNAFSLPHVPIVTPINDTGIFGNAYDDEAVEEEVDMNNVVSSYTIPGAPLTKFLKDHPKDQEGIDYDEVFAPVARIKSIRLFMAYASFKDFVVYQIDVKSAFLYGKIKDEVYVCQPPCFEDLNFPENVYKVEKTLYGLHQAPRAWYETLSTYLIDNDFHRGQIDKTLFIKRHKDDIMLVQVYVDDIIFQQKSNGIFISQDKYVADILKKIGFSTVKTVSTPIEHNKALVKDAEAENVDVHLYRLMIGSFMYLTASRPDITFVVCAYSPLDFEAYSDSDYAGASLDRKSTTSDCQFLVKRLISWKCKKQTIVANFTTEAEYVASASCCGQVLWIQNQMLDYGFNLMNTKIYIDNESTICIVQNPVFHSKTKHIEIRHHFIRDSYKKKLIQEDRMERVATTASSLKAEQDNEAQIRFKAASKASNDPPISRGHTLGSGEDNIKLK